jgi:hypothetical protein
MLLMLRSSRELAISLNESIKSVISSRARFNASHAERSPRRGGGFAPSAARCARPMSATREANRDGEGEKGREGHHRHHARDGESDVPITPPRSARRRPRRRSYRSRDRAGGEEHALPADGGLQGLGARPLAGEAIDILADRGAPISCLVRRDW